MEQRAGDAVRDVGDDLERLAGEEVPRMQRQRVRLDQLEVLHLPELPAQPRRQPRIELDGDDRCARRQQPPRQHAEPRSDLDDPVARLKLGRLDDRVERDWIGQEVLREALSRSQPLGPHQAAQLPGSRRLQALRRERVRHAGTSHGSARFGIASRSGPERSPAASRNAAAAPIIAPLSVHHAGGGTSSVRPSADRRSPIVARSARLAATPPPSATRRNAMVAGRGDRLRRQRVDDRLLERGGQPVDRDRLAPLAIAGDLAQDRGLQPGEAEVVGAIGLRPRKPGRGRNALGRRRDRRSARIRQLEQPPDLVEGLAGRVVDGLAEERVATVIVHEDQLRVPATDHEAEERKCRLRRERVARERIGQPVRVDVALDVVHADQRKVVGDREGLGEVHADEQGADEPRPVRHRHRVEVRPIGLRLVHRGLERRHDPAQLLARCHLRHDPTGRGVQRDLAGHLVRLDPAPIDDDRDPRLVARRLDRQDAGVAHPASRLRSLAMTRRIRASVSAGVVMTSASSPSSL